MNILRDSSTTYDRAMLDWGIELGTRLADVPLGSSTSHETAIDMIHLNVDTDGINVLTAYPRSYNAVIKDIDTGLIIKLYERRAEALLQFTAMNALHGMLARADNGVSAVSHPLLLLPDTSDRAVAIIEPVYGRSTDEDFERGFKELSAIELEVRHRVTAAIGQKASGILVNDISACNNVFESSRGYHLIDQPLLERDAAAQQEAVAFAIEDVNAGDATDEAA